MKICQVINALDRADAVSLHLLETDRMLRQLGHETEIYYEFAHRSVASRGRPISRLEPDAADLVLFHYAGFSRILPRVARVEGKRGLVFHNVTPPYFFEDAPETLEFCQRAIDQMPELPALFDFGLGVSHFNVERLRELGFTHTRVQPIAWETSGLDAFGPDSGREVFDESSEVHLLVVGRAAPHKGLHYAVEAVPEIEARLGRRVQLSLVGRMGGYEAYLGRLRSTIAERGLGDRVELVGEVSTEALRGWYRRADVLLQLSEHEGFCVPLVEAMALGVPVVAAGAGAIAETMGGAGILLDDRTPAEIARGVAQALGEGRTECLKAQGFRSEQFSRPVVRERLGEMLEWVEGVPRRQPPTRRPSVSIVICTYNRVGVLGRCLEELRRLDYPDFEVVVVEGPSTDGTAALLDGYGDVKRVENPTRNLSVSRNLGIAASAGEIVAFIDDDAVPARDWLRALVATFDDPTVGAAGGNVFGPAGDHLQFENGILSRYGRVRAHRPEPGEHNDAGGPWYNTLMGTNSSFRRTALESVGGFDENYEYYHDEADLCARIIDAGFRVVHVPRAVVWHGFEPGTARKTAYEFDFTVIVKNSIYFAACLSDWRRKPWRVFGALGPVAIHPARVLRWLLRLRIGPATALRGLAGWFRGVGQGIRKGLFEPPRRILAQRRDPASAASLPYRRAGLRKGRAPLHVALLSQQYPPEVCGGIGVYTEQLARGLVEAGHRVSVLAAGQQAAIDLRDGVEVHRIPSAPWVEGMPLRYAITGKNLARSLAVARVVRSLVRSEGVQLVESPIWDAEGYATLLAREVPLVLRLNTPMALAGEMQGWPSNPDRRLAAELEWSLLRGADAVIDPSGSIVETIRARYDVAPGAAEIVSIPFGTVLPDDAPKHGGGGIRFLFLGRFEPRKGIDTLLGAIPRVLDAVPDASFDLAGSVPPPDSPRSILEGLSPAVRARVRIHGEVDDATRASLYDRADLFVAPSRYESFGIVYIEAMAHGCACVAGESGGPSAIVQAGRTGVLVPPGDVDALAASLIDLARHPDRVREMGRAARRYVEENHTVEAMVDRSIEVYEAALTRWRGAYAEAAGG